MLDEVFFGLILVPLELHPMILGLGQRMVSVCLSIHHYGSAATVTSRPLLRVR